jgi:hypothetical protein
MEFEKLKLKVVEEGRPALLVDLVFQPELDFYDLLDDELL